MEALFKTLEFIDEKERTAFGRFVHFINDKEIGGCEIPQLMTLETSLRKLKKVYPNQNFEGVRLVTLKVAEIKTNNS